MQLWDLESELFKKDLTLKEKKMDKNNEINHCFIGDLHFKLRTEKERLEKSDERKNE